MKRRFRQIICFVALSGTFIGGSYSASAQDTDKEMRHEAKQEVKRERAVAKIEHWSKRHKSKIIKQLEKEQRFNTPSTARGSEVGYLDTQGKYITIGYIDKSNQFRKYQQ